MADIIVIDSNSVDLTKTGNQIKADVIVSNTDTMDLEIGPEGLKATAKKIDGGNFT